MHDGKKDKVVDSMFTPEQLGALKMMRSQTKAFPPFLPPSIFEQQDGLEKWQRSLGREVPTDRPGGSQEKEDGLLYKNGKNYMPYSL